MRIFGYEIKVTKIKRVKEHDKWKTEVFKVKKQRASRLVAKIDKCIHDNFHLEGVDGKPSVFPIKKHAVVSYEELLSIWNTATYVRDDV